MINEMLYLGTKGNTNYFTFHLIGYMYKYKLVNPFKYTTVSDSKVNPMTESLPEEKMRIQILIYENNWSISELTRQLGVSTTWVSMILNSE